MFSVNLGQSLTEILRRTHTVVDQYQVKGESDPSKGVTRRARRRARKLKHAPPMLSRCARKDARVLGWCTCCSVPLSEPLLVLASERTIKPGETRLATIRAEP